MDLTEKVSARNKFTYSIGGIGRDMLYTLVSMYLFIYLSYYVGLDKGELIGITIVMIITRIWDAVNDPMMGVIIENTKSKYGKFKPWILAGALTNALVTMLLFTDFGFSGFGFVLWFAFLYLLWEMTYTMNDISYWTMYSTFSVDQKEREKVGSLARICANIGAFGAVVLIPLFYSGNKSGSRAFQWMAIVIGVLFILCQLLVVFGVKEQPNAIIDQAKKEKAKISFKKMVKVIFQNDQLVIIALVILLFNVGFYITINCGQFYFNYVYLNYGGFEYSLFALALGGSQLLALLLYPLFSKRFNRKQMFKLSVILVVIGYLGFLLCSLILPQRLAGLLVFGFILFFGEGLIQLIVLVLLTDTIEYGQWKLGKRYESIYFALNPFVTKLASAVYILFVNGTMLLSGLYQINKRVSEMEKDKALGLIDGSLIKDYINSNVDKYMQNSLIVTMLIIPLFFIVGSYLFYRRKYRIDEKFYGEIIAELKERTESQE